MRAIGCLSAGVAGLCLATEVAAATLPAGFAETRLASGLNNVTAMSIAPDGRIFVSEQAGTLRVIKNDVLLPAPALTVTVDATNERGLLGTAFDPDFASNGYLYVYYTTPAPAPHNRISRFTLSGDQAAAGSEQVLMNLPPLGLAPIHNGGSMHVGADGKLYVSVGENFTARNAQSLETPLGKLLRINRDGTIPIDNPFYGRLAGDNRAIWAYGLRNPYTFAIQPVTGRIFVNDVGDKLFDEINEIVKGGNYGWPETEGPHDDARFEKPFFAQPWSPGNCTLIGAAFYNPVTSDFPPAFAGKYFFADLCGNTIKVMDAATRVPELFASGLATPVDLDVAPDGRLYYLNRGTGTGTGELFRVFQARAAPTIAIHPQSQLVSAGDSVTMTCAGNGAAPLSIRWERAGAVVPAATSPSLTFVVAVGDSGASFRCVISNSFGAATSNPGIVTVTANRSPTATILTPAAGATYAAGTTLSFTGEASDAEDGVLPASAFNWEVLFAHDDHTHPGVVVTGARGGSYPIANIGETATTVRYRIILRVTDSAGLSRVVEREVRPQLTRLTVASSPGGRVVKLDGQPKTTGVPGGAPLTFDAVVGITRTLEAPAFQQEREASPVWYQFQSWSDGGGALHTLNTPAAAATTYTATFSRIEYPPCITFEPLSRFINMPLYDKTGTFTEEFQVTPTAAPVNGSLGLSDGPRGGLPGQAALVSFNAAGQVTVRDVTAARADTPFAYAANVTYRVRMTVNITNHTYAVWIAPAGGAEVQLASNYGFRAEHSLITQLNNWGVFVASSASGGTLKVCHAGGGPPVVVDGGTDAPAGSDAGAFDQRASDGAATAADGGDGDGPAADAATGGGGGGDGGGGGGGGAPGDARGDQKAPSPSGGCGCVLGTPAASPGIWVWLAMGLLLARRVRRRPRR